MSAARRFEQRIQNSCGERKGSDGESEAWQTKPLPPIAGKTNSQRLAADYIRAQAGRTNSIIHSSYQLEPLNSLAYRDHTAPLDFSGRLDELENPNRTRVVRMLDKRSS